jgi:hypothetical protein
MASRMKYTHVSKLFIFLFSIVASNAFQQTSPLSKQSSLTQLKQTTLDDKDLNSINIDINKNKKKDLPKYSQAIPFLNRPKYLTLELAGDVGFDPLNFATNQESLYEYREAEIKHGRLAMLASAGWVFSELYDESIASYVGMEPILNSNDRVPSLFNGGMDKVNPLWWGFCLGFTAAIDLYGVQRARAEIDGYKPGDLGFDPLNLYPGDEDPEGRKRMELAEIKHCRLAMIAITAFSVQEFVTKVGIVDETPLFFKPFFVQSFLQTFMSRVN